MFFSCFLLLLAFNVLSAGRVPQPEERIIGGRTIEIEQAPWQVSLQVDGQHYCGGSIYSKDIIITAAHCRFTKAGRRLEAEDFKIRVGSALSISGGRLAKVAAIKSFETYVYNDTFNDIAVMRLSEPLEFSNKVQTISLAEYIPAPGTSAYATGWGATSAQHYYWNGLHNVVYAYPEHLYGVWVKVNWSYVNGAQYYIHQNLILVGSAGQTACFGDSGGPLIINQQLVGVTALVSHWCNGQAYYTSVSYFRGWILNAIKSI